LFTPPREETVVMLFFDILHRDELHLDDQGEEFATLEDAHASLIDTMREFMRRSEDAHSFIRPGTAIDITDRQHLRRILPVMELMADIATPMRKAA
jgi:hypothetical protein